MERGSEQATARSVVVAGAVGPLACARVVPLTPWHSRLRRLSCSGQCRCARPMLITATFLGRLTDWKWSVPACLRACASHALRAEDRRLDGRCRRLARAWVAEDVARWQDLLSCCLCCCVESGTSSQLAGADAFLPDAAVAAAKQQRHKLGHAQLHGVVTRRGHRKPKLRDAQQHRR